MFEGLKNFFKPQPQSPCTCGDCQSCEAAAKEVVPKEPQLYELVITFYPGTNREPVLFSDLVEYKYSVHRKTEVLDIYLTYKNGDYKQLFFNRGTWFNIESRNQEIKLADIDQVKAAWEPPIERKLPEFPVTLDSQ